MPDDLAAAITVQHFDMADLLVCCAGCGENIVENRLEHDAGCSEVAALRAQGAAAERERIRAGSTFVRGLKNGEDAYVVRAALLDGDGDDR